MLPVTDQDAGGAPKRGVLVSYFYETPREAVFKAWLDPDQVAAWWRPEGLEIPRESVAIEPRVGGRFQLTMVEPGGESHSSRAVFRELVEPELIVIEFEPMPYAGIVEPAIVRAVFEVEGEGTRMTVTAGPYTDQARRDSERGWASMVVNLERLLAA
jgi:uncharacterized protein YndB with AHSA1/START domain